MPRLDVNVREFGAQSTILETLVDDIESVPLRFQKVVGELIMLRLFSLFEVQLEALVVKVACGSTYLDGTAPQLLLRAASRPDAVAKMRTYNRAKATDLGWTTAAAIKRNVQHIVDSKDPLFSTLDMHDGLIDEMRRVRNHIAHSNADTRRKFRPVVESYYGAYVGAVTPSVLLLSRRHVPPILRKYIIQCRVIVRDLARA